jgi:hypothetical protein
MISQPGPAPNATATPSGSGWSLDHAVLVAALIGLVAAYAGALWALDALPYQDVPNHLARAVAISDLLFDGGRRFGAIFSFEWQFAPYILGDLVHATTLRWLAPEAAARVWVIVSVLAFPAATWMLLREWGAMRAVRAAGAAFAVFLAADWFLRLGFLNFRYGLALALFAVIAWERVVARPTVGRAAAYALLVIAGYLMHLSALVFLIAIVGTLSALRLLRDRAGFWRYVAAGAPLLLFLGWHLAFGGSAELGESKQPPLLNKVARVGAALAPTREPFDVGVALLFIVLVAGPLLAMLLRTRGRGWPPHALEALALSIAFTAVYFVLPELKGNVWGVDIRALPFIWLFAALALVLALRPTNAVRVGVAAVGVGALHLVALSLTLSVDNGEMREYRRLAATVPPGSHVLTVVTRARRGAVSPTAHAGSFATIYARAVVPYTFTGDLDAPMPYFNFRERPPPFPWQWWYVNRLPVRPAPRLVNGWEYLLVQQPVDWRRLPASIDVMSRNSVVVLARVRPEDSLRTAAAREPEAATVPGRTGSRSRPVEVAPR